MPVHKGDVLSITTTYKSKRASWYESMGLAIVWMADGSDGRFTPTEALAVAPPRSGTVPCRAGPPVLEAVGAGVPGRPVGVTPGTAMDGPAPPGPGAFGVCGQTPPMYRAPATITVTAAAPVPVVSA